MIFKISTLRIGHYMQVIKKPGTSFKSLLVTLYRWSLYRDKFDLKT